MKENQHNLIAAILATGCTPGSPEVVLNNYEAIREQLKKNDDETFTVPITMQPLLKAALEERARRERGM